MSVIHLGDAVRDSMQQGLDAYADGDYTAAIQQVRYAALHDGPRDRDWALLARIYGECGAYAESNRLYHLLLRRSTQLEYLVGVAKNLIADGKVQDAQQFVTDTLGASFRFQDIPPEAFEDMVLNKLDEWMEEEYDVVPDEEPPLLTAPQKRARDRYDRVLELEERGNYPDMMREALDYPRDGDNYAEVLEIIVHHMQHTFDDHAGAVRYARILRDVCPESALHFAVLYPETPEDQREEYLQKMVSDALQFGYQDDLEQVVSTLITLGEYARAKATNDRFLAHSPYQEKLWCYRVCLAYLLQNGEGGGQAEQTWRACKRLFGGAEPFHPFGDAAFFRDIQWMRAHPQPDGWRQLALGTPDLGPALDFFTGHDPYDLTDEETERTFAFLLRNARCELPFGDWFYRCDHEERVRDLYCAYLADPSVQDVHKPGLLRLLFDMRGAVFTLGLSYENRYCKGRVQIPMPDQFCNPCCDAAYALLLARLFLDGHPIDCKALYLILRRVDLTLKPSANRSIELVLAAANVLYVREVEEMEAPIPEICAYYGVKPFVLKRFLLKFNKEEGE